MTIEAADTIIENNRINNVLFGIFIAQADRALIRENKIESRTDFDLARKGDAIRVWYSKNVHIVNNQINNARDVVAWYSNCIIFKGNIIEQGRYGIHLMYCNQAEISNNKIFRNSVGIYTMYSKDVVMQDNDIRFQRGPSGYAIGFKDSENILVTNNLIVDNRAGFFLDGTPYTPSSYARFHDNIVAYNDIGALLLSFVSRIDFERNDEVVLGECRDDRAAHAWGQL